MWVTGHLSTAYLMSHRPRRAIAIVLIACTLGAFAPDVIDKALLWGGLSNHGRTIGHSVLVWTIFAPVALLLSRLRDAPRELMVWFGLGVLSHFAIDMVDDLFSGVMHTGYMFSAWWGWPVIDHRHLRVMTDPPLPYRGRISALELVLTVATMLMIVRRIWAQRVAARPKPVKPPSLRTTRQGTLRPAPRSARPVTPPPPGARSSKRTGPSSKPA